MIYCPYLLIFNFKTMKNLKLTIAENDLLQAKEMSAITGGASCGCSCRYANNGGSSTADNSAANNAGGLHSTDMKEHLVWKMNEDGSWSQCEQWVVEE